MILIWNYPRGQGECSCQGPFFDVIFCQWATEDWWRPMDLGPKLSLIFSAVFSKKIMLKMKGSSSSKCCIVIFLITVKAYTIVTSLDNGLALTPPSKRNIYSRFNFNLSPFLVTWDACFERSWFTIFSGYRRFAYLTQHFLFKCRWNFSLEY